MSGERQDAGDTDEFVTEGIPEILLNYDDRDIFNADETAFLFRLMPWRTYAFKDEDVAGGKKRKDRLTLMLACNMDGSQKLKAMVIGKARNPKCVRDSGMSTNELPVDYFSNKKGWMTGRIFDEWLSRINRKMVYQDRHIAMIVDNASSHTHREYSNIKLVFLPPNTTSLLQPLDMGILRSVKSRYRKKIAEIYLQGVEADQDKKTILRSLNFLRAVNLIAECWEETPRSVIENCWRRAHFSRARRQ